MSFEALLGNEQLKRELSASLRKGHISHCYLISGPEGSGKHTLARLLAAAILCSGEDKPCMGCAHCRKALEGNHPDFITVDDPEKKTVSVELIRSARADVYIQPNEAEHKLYLFPRAQDMGIAAQNALLKVLEEPPAYAVFFLITDNPEKLLPTVRSRCRELKMRSLPMQLLIQTLGRDFPEASREALEAAAERSGGFLGQARKLLEEGAQESAQTEGFLKGFAGGDTLALAETLAGMEKWKRDALIDQLGEWLRLLEEALVCRGGGHSISQQARSVARSCSGVQIYHGIGSLKKAVEYAQSNVSPGAICGWLLWNLRNGI